MQYGLGPRATPNFCQVVMVPLSMKPMLLIARGEVGLRSERFITISAKFHYSYVCWYAHHIVFAVHAHSWN